MKLTISKEVPYTQYVVHPVDDNGWVNYERDIDTFDVEMDESKGSYWRVEVGGLYVDSIIDTIPYERVKEYTEYLEGWFETHKDHDYISFNEWTRGDEAL